MGQCSTSNPTGHYTRNWRSCYHRSDDAFKHARSDRSRLYSDRSRKRGQRTRRYLPWRFSKRDGKERVVIYRHALKNALIPVVTVVGLQFGALLGGAVLTETVFAINGLGKLIIDAIQARDFPVVQGGVLVVSLLFVLVNMLVDITYRYLNKRIDLN